MNVWELHPALVHFPIALLLSGVALDLLGWWRSQESLMRTATWLLIAGVLTGVLAANFGLLAFYTVPAHTDEAHRLIYWHLSTATASLVLFAWVATARWLRRNNHPSSSSRVFGLVAAGALTVAGYLGGRIVYHGGAGVDPALLASALREGHSHGGHASHDMHGESKGINGGVAQAPHDDEDGRKPGHFKESKAMQHAGHEHEITMAAEEDQQDGHDSHEKPPADTEREEQAKADHRDAAQHEEHRENSKEQATPDHKAKAKSLAPRRLPEAPRELPRVPLPDAKAAEVPSGYRVEVVADELEYPTSIEFDDAGTMFVAEGGYIYGDDVAPARVLRFAANGTKEVIANQLSGPVTDLLWHEGRLFISHRGKISVLEPAGVRDLVTELPSLGDHHNNQMSIGPDGRLYFGQGTATNSGVVGSDNFKMGWLAKHSTVHDVPAKDIRLRGEERGQGHAQEFETANVLAMLHGNVNLSGEEEGEKGLADEMEGMKHLSGTKLRRMKEVQVQDHDEKGMKKTGMGKDQHKNMKGMTHGEEDVAKDEGNGKTNHRKTDEGKKLPAQEQPGEGIPHDELRRELDRVVTGPFQPFGKAAPPDGVVRGETKSNGTILRMNPDGSDLEVYAWGLRNPFGVMWGPGDMLYVTDNGYDERGSRPIAHAPDTVWTVRQDGWYGFPDYVAGNPVTESQFRPEHGPAPEFLMRDHPPIERPLATLKAHAGVAKMDFSRSRRFGFEGQMFLALVGDMNPMTGKHQERSGFEVIRLEPSTGHVEPFFRTREADLGPKHLEHVQTAGPKRPTDVRFSPDGGSLYVVDIGAVAILPTAVGPMPRPFPRTGVVWRITRDVSPSR